MRLDFALNFALLSPIAAGRNRGHPGIDWRCGMDCRALPATRRAASHRAGFGLEGGLFHQYAERYIEILARSGVTVEERMTAGAGDNLQLLEDPHSGVDIGFTQGGIAKFPVANDVVMLSNLYYLPMWIFYRNTDTFNHVNELRNHRVAVGAEGSGTRSLVEPVFALNDLTTEDVTMLPLGNDAALVH